jgi:hypothetical protein
MTIELELPTEIADKIEKQPETNQVFILAAIREKLKRREKKELLQKPEVKAQNGEAGLILDAWVKGYPKYHNGEEYEVGKHDYKVCQSLVQYDRNELWKRLKRYVKRNGAFYLGHPLTKFRWNEYSDAEWSKHEANIAAVKDKGKQQAPAIRRSTASCPKCGEDGINLQTHVCKEK